MARRRKHMDGRGRPWPEIKMIFKVEGVRTSKPAALEQSFSTALNKLCRKYGLDGVTYSVVGGRPTP